MDYSPNIWNSNWEIHLFRRYHFRKRKSYEIKSAQSTKQIQLGIKNLLKIEFPLPPLPIQGRIVGGINARREQIKTLRENAQTKREQAKADFENALFDNATTSQTTVLL